MDWNFVTHHLLSGYPTVAAALVLYFIVLGVAGKKQTAGHIAASFVFCFYLVGILTMTGVCIKGTFSPRIVYVPFVDMIRGPVDTILNVLLFVPLGVFLPLLYGKFDGLGKVALAGLLISLSVELAQMFGSGATDINDLITNTAGACLGYGVFRLLRVVIPEAWLARLRGEGAQCYWEPPLFWLGSLLIMLTVQIALFHALFAARAADGELQVWK